MLLRAVISGSIKSVKMNKAFNTLEGHESKHLIQERDKNP